MPLKLIHTRVSDRVQSRNDIYLLRLTDSTLPKFQVARGPSAKNRWFVRKDHFRRNFKHEGDLRYQFPFIHLPTSYSAILEIKRLISHKESKTHLTKRLD